MAMYDTKLNYNGEPCTWRHVSTVRGQALGNLPQKCGKAPSAEPTKYNISIAGVLPRRVFQKIDICKAFQSLLI